MRGVCRAEVKYNKRIGEELFLLGLKIRKKFFLKPGEFFMLRIQDGRVPLLNRPLSWFRYFPQRQILEFAYQVVGAGTKILSRAKAGEELVLLGPLGKGFEFKNLTGQVWLIAGGMGMAGLWALAEELSKNKKCELDLVWGVKSKDRFFLLKELPKRIRIHLATEDGSRGKKGLATDLAKELLEKYGTPTQVFACGPKAMLKELARLAEEKKISGQVLYEERMACGVGACLGCAVPSKAGGYLQACIEGPAFKFAEIDWERVR